MRRREFIVHVLPKTCEYACIILEYLNIYKTL